MPPGIVCKFEVLLFLAFLFLSFTYHQAPPVGRDPQQQDEQEVRGEPRHEQTGSDPSPGTSWPGDLKHVLLPFWGSRMEGMINSRLLLGEKME